MAAINADNESQLDDYLAGKISFVDIPLYDNDTSPSQRNNSKKTNKYY